MTARRGKVRQRSRAGRGSTAPMHARGRGRSGILLLLDSRVSPTGRPAPPVNGDLGRNVGVRRRPSD